MSTILTILSCVCIGLIILAALIVTLVLLPYFIQLQFHKCKYCSHTMKYKGLKETKDDSHYLFHCSHCGAWEEVPKEVFISKFLDKDNNPYEQSYDIE